MASRMDAAWAFLAARLPDLADLPEQEDATFAEESYYLLERAYERYKPRSHDFPAFVAAVCELIDRYPELLAVAKGSFGETEFLTLSEGALEDADSYLRQFPDRYREIVERDALACAVTGDKLR